jgi:hypothetical protein
LRPGEFGGKEVKLWFPLNLRRPPPNVNGDGMFIEIKKKSLQKKFCLIFLFGTPLRNDGELDGLKHGR